MFMKLNIDLNMFVKKSIPFLIIILLVILINTILLLFLPTNHFINNEFKYTNMEYRKYKFKENFRKNQPSIKKVPTHEKRKKTKKVYTLTSNIFLNMIYQESDIGWIVITEKSSKDSIILGIGEVYKQYKLQTIYDDYVIFSKSGKDYNLELNLGDKKLYKLEEVKSHSSLIRRLDQQYIIDKSIINEYTQDYNKIWESISINESIKNGLLDGFKVTKIVTNSVFWYLGLLEGDIIKSINNVQLKSYSDVIKVFKQINNVKNIKFIVLRKNKEVELEYEIQ